MVYYEKDSKSLLYFHFGLNFLKFLFVEIQNTNN